jgi:hypothetical protein
MLAAQSNVEIEEVTVDDAMDETGAPFRSIDMKFTITRKRSKICVESVPLEEFRVTKNHNSINLAGARFAAHVTNKTLSDLRQEGLSEDKLKQLLAADSDPSSYRFRSQGEPAGIPDTADKLNEAMQLYQIAECYLFIDIDGDGIAEYMKITCGGIDQPTVILDEEELESSPWIAATAILMSHKFQGLSIYDRIKEIQDHKTSLIRNIQNNLYLQNNQRNKILEGQVNVDDLMESRPGGGVRVKSMGALEPIVTPQIGPAAFEMMRYLDEVRAGRSGVSSDGPAAPQAIGHSVGSEGVERLMTSKEELVGLIIRVIAETALKPLCIKIRDLARQHVDTIEDFKFRGQWVQVHPASWIPREECTVRVGTGSGDTRGKVGALNRIIELQSQAMAVPGQALVNQSKIYGALDDFCKYSGLNGAEKYFVDPTSPEGQQATQQAEQQQGQQQAEQQAQQQAMLQMQQSLAEAELMKAKAAQENVALKAKVEEVKHLQTMQKQTFDAQTAALKAQLERATLLSNAAGKDQETEYKYDKMNMDAALKLTEMEATSNTQEDLNFKLNKNTVEGNGGTKSNSTANQPGGIGGNQDNPKGAA